MNSYSVFLEGERRHHQPVPEVVAAEFYLGPGSGNLAQVVQKYRWWRFKSEGGCHPGSRYGSLSGDEQQRWSGPARGVADLAIFVVLSAGTLCVQPAQARDRSTERPEAFK